MTEWYKIVGVSVVFTFFALLGLGLIALLFYIPEFFK